MTDAVVAPVADSAPAATKKATKAKAPKVPKAPKTAKPKTAPSHPSYSDMIKKAIVESKDKSGTSKAALLKYILQNFKVGENIHKVSHFLKLSLFN